MPQPCAMCNKAKPGQRRVRVKLLPERLVMELRRRRKELHNRIETSNPSYVLCPRCRAVHMAFWDIFCMRVMRAIFTEVGASAIKELARIAPKARAIVEKRAIPQAVVDDYKLNIENYLKSAHTRYILLRVFQKEVDASLSPGNLKTLGQLRFNQAAPEFVAKVVSWDAAFTGKYAEDFAEEIRLDIALRKEQSAEQLRINKLATELDAEYDRNIGKF